MIVPNTDRQEIPAQDSTNSFAELAVFTCANVLSKSVALRETGGANDVDYRILGSVDGGQNYDETVVSSTALSAGTSAIEHITGYFTHLKVEITSSATDSPGTVEGEAAGIAA